MTGYSLTSVHHSSKGYSLLLDVWDVVELTLRSAIPENNNFGGIANHNEVTLIVGRPAISPVIRQENVGGYSLREGILLSQYICSRLAANHEHIHLLLIQLSGQEIVIFKIRRAQNGEFDQLYDMLNDSMAFGSCSTHNLEDTYHFYQEILGLEVDRVQDRFLHIRLPGDSVWVIYAKSNHQPTDSTVLNFQVKDIENIVDKLSARGVSFLQYGAPFTTDAKGISWDDEGSHLAWFKDPGGNILALIEN